MLVAGLGGALAGVGQAQIPGLPGPPGPGQPEGEAPPPPPVSDPGPLGDAATHDGADAARRGAIASGGLRPPLRSLWRQDFDALVSEAVVGDGRAYVSSGGRVTALDLATGARLWTSAVQVHGGLTLGGGKVIALAPDALVALDAATGAVAWSADTGDFYVSGSPLVAGDLVIVQDQGLHAFDLGSGEPRWSGGDSDGVDGAPAAAGDRIFQIGGCTVAAVDRRDGNVIWRRNRGCSGGTTGTVALQGDRVYSSFGPVPLAASDGRDLPGANADILAGDIGLQRESDGMAAVSLVDGRLLWQAPADDSVINDTVGAPFVVGDTVYRTRFEGLLEARDLATGAITFRGKLRTAKETFTGSSSASNFTIAGGHGVLVVLRGSTVDALGAAPEPPRSLALTVPPAARQLVVAGVEQVVRGTVAGDLLPALVQLEADPYPFDRFVPVGAPKPPGEEGVAFDLATDRNVRVRLVGLDGGALPTESYTLYAYPRIRFNVRNVRNLVTARISVRGSSDVRFRGRRVHLYIVRARTDRARRLGSSRLRGPARGRGRGVVRFRALRRVGRRDVLFACVPRVHRLGQGAPDRVQRRCGRARLRF